MSALEKSPDAFRTISEVADDLDVPQHVLRFWESKFAQVRPLKRAGGRRYYRPEDIDLLRGIRTLLYSDGFTIKGVQRVFREQGLRYVIETGRMAARLDLSDVDDRPLPVSRSHSGTATGHVANPDPDDDVETSEAADEIVQEGESSEDLSPRQRAALSSILDELEDLQSQLNGARGRAQKVIFKSGTRLQHEIA